MENDEQINITCSIGVSNIKLNNLMNNEECRNEDIMRADKALYKQKRQEGISCFDGE